jgi:transketolase
MAANIEYKNGALPPDKWEMVLTRQAYGEMLVELGEKNENIVVLDADLSESTLTKYFRDKFPERFVECGIAEQDMITTAAGISTFGYIPFMSSYAIFLAGRAWDQIRNTVDYSRLNVKVAAAHGGISVGLDGCSHQSMEDLSNMLSLVNMTVIVPADYWETRKMMAWIPSYDGPLYFRLGREKVPTVTSEASPFDPKHTLEIIGGTDGVIFACGLMLSRAVKAAEMLAESGVFTRVVNVHTLKPLNVEEVCAAAKECGAVVTMEEHSVYGGLGSVVARVLADNDVRVPMRVMGIPDMYLQSGKPEELLAIAGLTADNAAAKMREVLGRR